MSIYYGQTKPSLQRAYLGKKFVIQEYKHKYFINLKAIKYLPNI